MYFTEQYCIVITLSIRKFVPGGGGGDGDGDGKGGVGTLDWQRLHFFTGWPFLFTHSHGISVEFLDAGMTLALYCAFLPGPPTFLPCFRWVPRHRSGPTSSQELRFPRSAFLKWQLSSKLQDSFLQLQSVAPLTAGHSACPADAVAKPCLRALAHPSYDTSINCLSKLQQGT